MKAFVKGFVVGIGVTILSALGIILMDRDLVIVEDDVEE